MPSGDKDFWYDKLIEHHQEMIDALGTLSLVPIVEGKYSQPVERVLESAGFNVIVDGNNLYAGDLKTLKSTRTNFGPIAAKNYPRETAKDERVPVIAQHRELDLSDKAASMDVDYLAVLEVHYFNIRQELGAYNIPFTQPYGMGLVRLSLIDAKSGEKVFDDWGYDEKFAESGEWKQKGDWSNVLKITTEALEVSIERVMKNFSTAIISSGPTQY